MWALAYQKGYMAAGDDGHQELRWFWTLIKNNDMSMTYTGSAISLGVMFQDVEKRMESINAKES